MFLVLPVCLLMSSTITIVPQAEPTRIVVRSTIPPALRDALPPGEIDPDRGETRLHLRLIHPTTGKEGPAILGRYERRGHVLQFTPRHPLVAGQRYRATAEWDRDRWTIDYPVPARERTPPARVERVYPTARTLPANHLKFYVYFSRPMRQTDEIFHQIEIRDAKGEPVPDAWRRNQLWSEDGKRLTLWIHPGRVKQGISLRNVLGPVLEPDRKYTLHIPATVLDADGQPLGEAFSHAFATTVDDRVRPELDAWKLQSPNVGSRDALVVDFPEPLDHALLVRCLRIVDATGKTVTGTAAVEREERRWTWTPMQPWQAGDYRLEVDDRLEDLAGNTPTRLFEVDLTRPAEKPGTLVRGFRIAP